MNIIIRHRMTRDVIWEGEAESLKDAVEKLVLGGANLGRADLGGANLGMADLRRADLLDIKADVYAVLGRASAEAPALLAALREGRVDGSAYEGECACLVGTIANARGCNYESIPGIAPDASRPAECWFLGINKGDTPATNPISAITAEWVEAFISERA
jgi:hypothetical protein